MQGHGRCIETNATTLHCKQSGAARRMPVLVVELQPSMHHSQQPCLIIRYGKKITLLLCVFTWSINAGWHHCHHRRKIHQCTHPPPYELHMHCERLYCVKSSTGPTRLINRGKLNWTVVVYCHRRCVYPPEPSVTKQTEPKWPLVMNQ